jgi:hypothetical protein
VRGAGWWWWLCVGGWVALSALFCVCVCVCVRKCVCCTFCRCLSISGQLPTKETTKPQSNSLGSSTRLYSHRHHVLVGAKGVRCNHGVDCRCRSHATAARCAQS